MVSLYPPPKKKEQKETQRSYLLSKESIYYIFIYVILVCTTHNCQLCLQPRCSKVALQRWKREHHNMQSPRSATCTNAVFSRLPNLCQWMPLRRLWSGYTRGTFEHWKGLTKWSTPKCFGCLRQFWKWLYVLNAIWCVYVSNRLYITCAVIQWSWTNQKILWCFVG